VLELALRDVNAERNAENKLIALHFGESYVADVNEAAADATLFSEEYTLAATVQAFMQESSNPSSAYIKVLSNVPSSMTQAISILRGLPKEAMPKADIDLKMISNISNRWSYLSQARLWCGNSK